MQQGNGNNWWKMWAPYWKFFESQYLDSAVLEKLSPYLSSPILLIGAGQGLVADELRRRGFVVQGIDFQRDMIEEGVRRRGVTSILADARDLPFKGKAFKTVIITTGVVDHSCDKEHIKRITSEANRVISPFGNLIVAFYQISPPVEQIYRRLGALDPEEKFHMKRIFEISVHPRPWRCVPMICEWTKKSYLMTMLRLIYTSMTLPKYLKENNRKFHDILELAKKDNVDPAKLIHSLPVDLPYRKETDIRELLADLGLKNCHFDFHDECITARYYKSPLLTARKEDARKSLPQGSSETEPVIRARDLCKKYGKAKHYAVDRLNFTIGSGTVYGILGPNGAGKTTTLMMLSGLLEPSKGTIRFFKGGAPINGREIKRMIGFVPQDLALYLKLTARENLRYFAGLYGMHGESLARRVDELLELVGLRERADELVNHYSSGMKRRLNLAVGLTHEPMIIFLDEPTVGIDPQSRNCIFESVIELKNKGATILYTTHYMEEANKLCDRVAIMDRGKILLEGRPAELVGHFGLGRLVFKTGAAIPGSFVKALAALAPVHNTDQSPERLTINTAGDAAQNVKIIEDILKVAAQHGVDMSLINIVEPTLESLFLDITGRDFRDSQDEGAEEQVHARING